MTGQISEDGNYMWDGANWIPNPNAPAAQNSGAAQGIDAGAQSVVESPAMATTPATQQTMVQAEGSAGVYGTGTWKIQMADSGLGMFFLRIGCLLVNVCTLFFGCPIYKCDVLQRLGIKSRYRWSVTKVYR